MDSNTRLLHRLLKFGSLEDGIYNLSIMFPFPGWFHLQFGSMHVFELYHTAP